MKYQKFLVEDGSINIAADVFTVIYGSDNFGYVVVDRSSGQSMIVDGADPNKLELILHGEGIESPKFVLTTHYHHDHSGGNGYWRKKFPDCPVVGSKYQKVPDSNMEVADGTKLSLGDLCIECIHTPCHTKGDLCYLITSTSDPTTTPIVFTGDFLFYGGCGRFFEGTAQTMASSIEKIYERLPSMNCRMFPGHEYAKKNLQFAASVMERKQISEATELVQKTLKESSMNLGSTFEQELEYNPFIRCTIMFEEMKNEIPKSSKLGQIKSTDKIELLAELRRMKDAF